MRVVIGIVVALLAVVAITLVTGMLLPREHRASSRITVHRPPEAVWAVVRDLGALMGTWSELRSVTHLPDRAGKEMWEQNAGGFALRFIVEESVPPARLVTRIDAAQDATFGGVWTYQIAPVPGGATVTVTEDGYVNNPLFRTMMKVMGVHKTIDGYLTALGKKLGENLTPEHLR